MKPSIILLNQWLRHAREVKMKIIDYMICKVDFYQCREAVKELMSGGWQPFGAPFVYDKNFVQALVKYEE